MYSAVTQYRAGVVIVGYNTVVVIVVVIFLFSSLFLFLIFSVYSQSSCLMMVDLFY